MRTARPLLIATLASRTSVECRTEIEEARRSGADLAEIRFDRWPPDELARVGELFPAPIPLMATLRSRAEGGEGPDEPNARKRILEELERHPFRLVDHELQRDASEPVRDRPNVPSVLSAHLPNGTGAAEVHRCLWTDPQGAEFVKVVVPATLSEALGPLLEAVPPPGSGARVLHTTGGSGPLFRAWAWRMGFPAVFGRLSARSGLAPIEPAQIPVEDLRQYFDGDAPGPLFAVIGHPVHHSRSPALFARWMRKLGDHGLYVAFDVVSESEFVDAVPAFASGGFRGLNITRPWKGAAIELASALGPGAGPCGSANVLTLGGEGSVEAANTDLLAILRRMAELVEAGTWDGHRLVVAGTGGAARAALVAARTLGAEATIVGRSRAAAEQLAREFGANVGEGDHGEPRWLLVQATALGRAEAGPPAIDLSQWIRKGTHVLDFVYDPDDPWVSVLAGGRGATYEDGYRLLVYQASESYRIWWGHAIPADELERTVRERA